MQAAAVGSVCMMNPSEWKQEFAVRFRRHEEELKWLFCEIYHNDLHAYDYFVLSFQL